MSRLGWSAVEGARGGRGLFWRTLILSLLMVDDTGFTLYYAVAVALKMMDFLTTMYVLDVMNKTIPAPGVFMEDNALARRIIEASGFEGLLTAMLVVMLYAGAVMLLINIAVAVALAGRGRYDRYSTAVCLVSCAYTVFCLALMYPVLNNAYVMLTGVEAVVATQ